MSGIGSNSGGSFQAPHIPQKSSRQAKDESGVRASKASVAKPTTSTSKPAKAQLPEKQAEVTQKRQSQANTDLRKQVTKSRSHADSFHKKVSTGTESSRAKTLGDLASEVKKGEDKKQKATEFAKRINAVTVRETNSRKPSIDKSEAQQNHQIAAQAIQSNEDLSGNKKKSKAKKDSTEAKLEKIFSLGGDRGRKFVAFIKREQAKGELSESIIDLIGDFYMTLRGDSLSASELVNAGEENLNLMRSMVSSENPDEISAIQNALSSSIVNPASERADLLALRNVEKNAHRVSPPSPSQEAKATPTEAAIEFVSSIDFGVVKAPWDHALIAA